MLNYFMNEWIGRESSRSQWHKLEIASEVDGKLAIHSCFKTSIVDCPLDWKTPSLHDGLAAVPICFPIILCGRFL